MLGFANISPNAIRIILDREKFNPFVIVDKTSTERFKKEVGKVNVALINSSTIIKHVDLSDFDAAALFDSIDVINKLESVDVIDAESVETDYANTWVIKRITPKSINILFDSEKSGVPSSEQIDDIVCVLDCKEATVPDKKLKHTPVDKNKQDMGPFEVLMDDILNDIEHESDASEIQEYICAYISGLVKAREYNRNVKKVGLKGNEKILKIRKFMDSKPGDRIRATYFYKCKTGKDIEELCRKTGAYQSDAEYVAAVIPPSESADFQYEPKLKIKFDQKQ